MNQLKGQLKGAEDDLLSERERRGELSKESEELHKCLQAVKQQKACLLSKFQELFVDRDRLQGCLKGAEEQLLNERGQLRVLANEMEELRKTQDMAAHGQS